MPIFEFICDQCGNFFEELVRVANSPPDIICPDCQSNQVSKQFSVFASKISASTALSSCSSPTPSASCNSGGL